MVYESTIWFIIKQKSWGSREYTDDGIYLPELDKLPESIKVTFVNNSIIRLFYYFPSRKDFSVFYWVWRIPFLRSWFQRSCMFLSNGEITLNSINYSINSEAFSCWTLASEPYVICSPVIKLLRFPLLILSWHE